MGRNLGKRTLFFIVATALLFIVVMLPFALTSGLSDILEQSNPTYYISDRNLSPRQHTAIHLDLVSLNEWEGAVTVRVSAHDSCTKNCTWQDRILFVSILQNKNQPGDIAPSETITFPSEARDITDTIDLPTFGDPIRYPFDDYSLGLGIIMERVYPDGRVVRLTPQEAKKHLIVTVQSRIPRITMDKPTPLEQTKAHLYEGVEEEYQHTSHLSFTRPLYMKILTILLLLLITGASAYAVFMSPLHDLLINSGALVLGVWGVRAILLGADQPGITAADLVLSIVVIFLLIAIIVRGLNLLGAESLLRVFTRSSESSRHHSDKN